MEKVNKNLWDFLDVLNYQSYDDEPEYKTKYYTNVNIFIRVIRKKTCYQVDKFLLPFTFIERIIEIDLDKLDQINILKTAINNILK